jgi:hypothetical protein
MHYLLLAHHRYIAPIAQLSQFIIIVAVAVIITIIIIIAIIFGIISKAYLIPIGTLKYVPINTECAYNAPLCITLYETKYSNF